MGGSKVTTNVNVTDNRTQNVDSTTTDTNIQNKKYDIVHNTSNLYLKDDVEGNVNSVTDSINNAY